MPVRSTASPTAAKRPGSVTPATSLDRSEGSVISALYRATIGPVNTDYYLPVFERFEAAGRVSPSWNRAACLCTLNWMVFRQLWAPALVYAAAMIGVALLVLGLGRLLFHFSDAAELCLLAALGTVAFLAPGVWGNAILYKHARKTMERALAATTSVPEACVLLNRQASSRQRMVWLALANVVLAGVVVAGVYIAWPHTARPAAVTGPVLTPAVAGLVAPAASAPVKGASVPAPMPAPALSQAPAAASPTAGPVVAASAPAATVAVPAPTPTPTPTPTVKASAAITSAGHFYINVGLFAEDDNARRAHAKLLEAGLTAFTEELDTAKGKRTRVRAGPFDTKTQADTAAEKIRALKLEAVVFRQ